MQNGYEHNYRTLVPKLANCDIDEAAARLGIHHSVNGSVIIRFLGRDYTIRSDGVFALDGQASDPNNRSILIHYITSKGCGDPENIYFLPHHFLPGHISPNRSGQGVFAGENLVPSQVIREIGNSWEKINNAMSFLGGNYEGELRNGEHAWKYHILPKIPMQLIYFEADDEFPCEIKVKFDGNAGRFIEFETLAFLCGSFIHTLVKISKTE